MFWKLLLICKLYVCLWSPIVVWTHLHAMICSSRVFRFVCISILSMLFFILKKLWPKWLDTTWPITELGTCLKSRIFGTKSTLCHVEILVFQLLYSAFQCPILVSKLYQLGIDFVNSGDFWLDVLYMTASTVFSILIIASLHDTFDLRGDKLIVVLTVILEYTLY